MSRQDNFIPVPAGKRVAEEWSKAVAIGRPRATRYSRRVKKSMGVQRGVAPLAGDWGCPPDVLLLPLPGSKGDTGGWSKA